MKRKSVPGVPERMRQALREDKPKHVLMAVTAEAARRVLHPSAFDVQLQAGLALHDGKIAEMQTGEGKTLRRRLSRGPELRSVAKASTS